MKCKKITKKFVMALIFNTIETILIFLIGRLLDLPIDFIIVIMLIYILTRVNLGNVLHFKDWKRCLFWSLFTVFSLFCALKIELNIAILLTTFSAFLATGKANLEDAYMWKPANQSKYSDIEEFIKYNLASSKLLDFEDNLKRYDELLYLIYKYRFKERLTFAEMSKRLDMENVRIVEKLDQVAIAIRINCSI